MNDRMNEIIKMAFKAPPPDRKEAFLRQLSYSLERKATWYDMIPSQIGYIHKGAWACAAMVFAAALCFTARHNENNVFMIAALTPFLALSVLVESWRRLHGTPSAALSFAKC